MTGTPHLAAQHRILFAAIVPFLLVFIFLFQPPLIWQIIALGPLVALLGVPHGALDHRVASELWPLTTPRDHAGFIVGYIGLSIAVVVLWIIAPSIALAAFLIYSAQHFSDDWRAEVGLWQSLPLGISVIALPALVFQSDVAVLFGFLIPEPTATLFAALLHKIAIAAIIASVLCLLVNLRAAPWVAVEYALLVVTAMVTPPLIYFVIYFCALHSPPPFPADGRPVASDAAAGSARRVAHPGGDFGNDRPWRHCPCSFHSGIRSSNTANRVYRSGRPDRSAHAADRCVQVSAAVAYIISNPA